MAGDAFRGGVAVVTGAGAGLGASMARRFAAEGMSVVAIDIDLAHAEATANGIAVSGGTAIAIGCDVSQRVALDAAATRVEAEFGSCTVLCANVGVQQFGAVDKLSESDWRWVLDVNVLGVIHTVNAFMPLLRRSSGNRRILVTSSSAAYSPGIRMAAYTTSKYAVTGYAETLRLELASEGIGVSILFPAGMSTSHLQSSQRARPSALGAMVIHRADIDAMMESRGIERGNHVATADYATRHLIAELARDARYIITHGDCSSAIKRNHDDLLAAQTRALEV